MSYIERVYRRHWWHQRFPAQAGTIIPIILFVSASSLKPCSLLSLEFSFTANYATDLSVMSPYRTRPPQEGLGLLLQRGWLHEERRSTRFDLVARYFNLN